MAVRKARGLLEAGAKRVRVVAVTFVEQMPAEVQRISAAFAPEQLEGAELVFAATNDPLINEAVVREARRREIWAHRADVDEGDPGDFATPALLRRGPLLITISTGGAPALAAAIRDELETKLDPRWEKMAEAMRELRPMIRQAKGLDIAGRRTIFRELASAEALVVLDRGGLEELKRWVVERHPELGANGLK